MLGKRFRRTTSMTQLGPSSPSPLKELGSQEASSIAMPYKAAKPLQVANEEDLMATEQDPPPGANFPHHAIHAETLRLQTAGKDMHALPPPPPSPPYGVPYQMGLWTGYQDTPGGLAHVTKPVPPPMAALMSSTGYGKLDQHLYSAVNVSPVGFLDVCFFCKRRLRHERDIFIYRGDTAFCSEECRHRQILSDERRLSVGASNQRKAAADATNSSETAVAA